MIRDDTGIVVFKDGREVPISFERFIDSNFNSMYFYFKDKGINTLNPNTFEITDEYKEHLNKYNVIFFNKQYDEI